MFYIRCNINSDCIIQNVSNKINNLYCFYCFSFRTSTVYPLDFKYIQCIHIRTCKNSGTVLLSRYLAAIPEDIHVWECNVHCHRTQLPCSVSKSGTGPSDPRWHPFSPFWSISVIRTRSCHQSHLHTGFAEFPIFIHVICIFANHTSRHPSPAVAVCRSLPLISFPINTAAENISPVPGNVPEFPRNQP